MVFCDKRFATRGRATVIHRPKNPSRNFGSDTIHSRRRMSPRVHLQPLPSTPSHKKGQRTLVGQRISPPSVCRLQATLQEIGETPDVTISGLQVPQIVGSAGWQGPRISYV